MEEDSGKSKFWIIILFLALVAAAIFYTKVYAPTIDPDKIAISQIDSSNDDFTEGESLDPSGSVSDLPHCTSTSCTTSVDNQESWPNCAVWKYTCSGSISGKCRDNPQGPSKSAAFNIQNCNNTESITYTCGGQTGELDSITKIFPKCETKVDLPNQPTINQVAIIPSPSTQSHTSITSTTPSPSAPTNTSVATTQTVISPSPTPSITPLAACKNILTYDKNWQSLSLSDFSRFKAGDQFYLCASGTGNVGTFTKAIFAVNGVDRSEVTFKKPDNTSYFCDLYTIPANLYELNITGKIYNTELGWK